VARKTAATQRSTILPSRQRLTRLVLRRTPAWGALNDIGGPQAATQGQRQLQAIKGEGFFQAFPQAGRSSGCTSYSGPKVFRKFPRIKMPDLEAKAKSSGSTATQRKIYAKIPPCG
jgi:hypothetical protein